MTVLASDTFDRANETPLGNGVWTGVTGEETTTNLTSNVAVSASAAQDTASRYSGTTWPDAHYSKIKVTAGTGGAGSGFGVSVRCATGSRTHYRLVINGDGEWELLEFSGGSSAALLSGTTTYSAGAYLELQANGTTLTCIYNGTTLNSTTDATITAGQAGLSYSSNISGCSGNDWEGGDFGGATVFPILYDYSTEPMAAVWLFDEN